MRGNQKDFALYKGEELLCIGTVKEIAKEMNISVSTVRFYGSEIYKNRTNGNGLVLVCLDDDEDDEQIDIEKVAPC